MTGKKEKVWRRRGEGKNRRRKEEGKERIGEGKKRGRKEERKERKQRRCGEVKEMGKEKGS
jgi:hypothetical protein